MEKVIKIFCDGGSRGNPGPAACAFVAYTDNSVVSKQSKYLGVKTNNQAEYGAVVLALKWIEENQGLVENTDINFYLDSELIVNQINRLYRVKDKKLSELYNEVMEVSSKIKNKIFFSHIYRNKNTVADGLVNQELDLQK